MRNFCLSFQRQLFTILASFFTRLILQEEEIRRLSETNQTLNERIKQKENAIARMEDVLQVSALVYLVGLYAGKSGVGPHPILQ